MTGSDEAAGAHIQYTHKPAATALFVGIGGAVIDVEMSEISLLIA